MLHIGQGTTVGSVTLFPVWPDDTPTGHRRYRLGTATLDISEADGGPSVSRLVAANTGPEPATHRRHPLLAGAAR